MFDFLNHTFMIYALILGLSLGIGASLLSPFLVLNHQAMIADGLSHVAFSGIIFGLLLSHQPIYFAIPFTIVASLAITYLGQIKMIEHDSAIGVVSAFALAIGIITINLADGFNRSIESLLVGTILTVTFEEVVISVVFLLILLLFILLLYRPLLSMTYDTNYAIFSDVKHNLLKYALSAITAVFIVLGIRTAGMLLISAYIIFPSLIASQISRGFRQTLWIGTIIALIIIFIGFTVSYHFDIPTGSTIVVIYTVLLILSIFYRRILRRAF